MKTRIISACVLVPLLALVFLGGAFITGAVFVITIIGLYEFYRGFRAMGLHPSYPIGVGSVCLLYAINIVLTYFHPFPASMTLYFYLFWLFLTVAACLLDMFRIDKKTPADAMATMTGIFYIALFIYHAVMVEDTFHIICGISPVWLILITAFCTDIGAYFGGTFLGKHKLCPRISPKKTVEGSIAGILASTLFSALFGWFFMYRHLMWAYVLIGIGGGIFSQFGDLTASIFKRKMGIKDYGNLIPGHGGILDRFDSVLFTSPLVFYILLFVYADKL